MFTIYSSEQGIRIVCSCTERKIELGIELIKIIITNYEPFKVVQNKILFTRMFNVSLFIRETICIVKLKI